MLRAIRRIVLLLCVAAISGGLLVTFTTRPDLESADSNTNAAWRVIEPQIDDRTEALAALNAAMIKAGRRVDLADELTTAVRTWTQGGGSLNERITTANALHAIGIRLLAIAGASPRFASDRGVIGAATRYEQQIIDPQDRDRLNTEIDGANAIRDGLLRRIVADALGFQDHPHLAT